MCLVTASSHMGQGDASLPTIAFLPIIGEGPGDGEKQGIDAHHIFFLGIVVGTKRCLLGSEATDESSNQPAIIDNGKGAEEGGGCVGQLLGKETTQIRCCSGAHELYPRGKDLLGVGVMGRDAFIVFVNS